MNVLRIKLMSLPPTMNAASYLNNALDGTAEGQSHL